ncbi:MAG: flavin reductase family protein [Thermoplasmatota archaeon]
MDEKAKKHALRLVPYGLYLAGSRHEDGRQVVSLASWFTQTSFAPPLCVVGLHREGAAFQAVQETGVLSLNILGEGDAETLKGFYKHVDVADGTAGALDVVDGEATGCPILPALPAAIELKVVEITEGGDHAAVLCEVVGAVVHDEEAGALTHGAAGLHYAG